MTSLIWLRIDLRLADNPALHAAVQRGGAIVPAFIYAPEEEAPWSPGGASRWWLHQSLKSLDVSLRALGSRLVIRRGPSLRTLRALLKETRATAVYWNRRYEPALIERDKQIKEALRADGVEVEIFNAALLHEPWTIQNQRGRPFQVFTPFWKHCLNKPDPVPPLTAARKLVTPDKWPQTLALEELELQPKIDWAEGMRRTWQPGEAGAQAQLKSFLSSALGNYSQGRNRPDLTGTSRLSPHLHFGEISPRQIWHAVRKRGESKRIKGWRDSQFVSELGWREFAHHLLYYFPDTPTEPLRENFRRFPWRKDPAFLECWQKGRTGYPIVDAGMRELWATGWMHNRVRMIVASFLVKDLLLSWREGAAWFWDTLVDADLAQNTLGWQWTAGCGADAAPYFRVFNPVSQGEKFDAKGGYVRKWCPELSRLPDEWLHKPWRAPTEVLTKAGVRLGRDYPEPVVIHAIAREVALEAYAKLKRQM
ncbi:MAG TPA: deoxyribodipyrimidine photo-lyase [Verrucomicrobiae bacterium]|nr:deoxyribodipyrimidine photo-lyase [Verrucomicrobiae bacterium]